MIKILHLISTLNVGGAETALSRLVAGMTRRGFSNVVVSMTSIGPVGDSLRQMGVRVVALGNKARPLPEPRSIWRFLSIVRRERPDVIQAWMYHANILAAVFRLWYWPVPVAWNVRNSYSREKSLNSTAFLVRLGALFSNLPACIVYNSQAGLESHLAIGYSPRRAKVIANGFDLDLFQPNAAKRMAFRNELGVDEATRLIGLVGRWHPDKDIPNFLKAAAQLAREDFRVKFVLVGYGLDEANEPLQALVRDSVLCERLVLLGQRFDLPNVLAGLDILTSSSLAESFSNVIGEAMACGLPCVVTDVGDSRQVVGDTGMVVPPRDPEALAAGWRILLRQTAEERLRLGLQARQRIAENYSLATCVQAYENLYAALGKRGN